VQTGECNDEDELQTGAGLAGVLISIAGARLIHAQQVKMPPAYVIAEVEVTDPVTLKKYIVRRCRR
jgi:hypothetical protein